MGFIFKGCVCYVVVLYEDKFFIVGGIIGYDNYVLDDICYLDFKIFIWFKLWCFVGWFDYFVYIWSDRVWVFGGLSEDMDKVSDLWWLDFKGNLVFEFFLYIGIFD